MTELTLERLAELERLRAPCAGREVKLACGKQEHAYVSALLWSAPELLAAARRLAELESALRFIERECGSLILGGDRGYFNAGNAVYEAKRLGWPGIDFSKAGDDV